MFFFFFFFFFFFLLLLLLLFVVAFSFLFVLNYLTFSLWFNRSWTVKSRTRAGDRNVNGFLYTFSHDARTIEPDCL